MKFGKDDQAGVTDVEAARARSQRFVQLSLMDRGKLASLYLRTKQKYGVREHPTEGARAPATKLEVIGAIMKIEADGKQKEK
jgi:hypothetical protein